MNSSNLPSLEAVLHALTRLRVPLQQGEYDLHALVRAALDDAQIPHRHEVSLAPRCRIDLLCGADSADNMGAGGIGIEIKRGQVDKKRVLAQLNRYAACEQVTALILVTEKTIAVPATLHGKPVRLVCLNRLWGIAL